MPKYTLNQIVFTSEFCVKHPIQHCRIVGIKTKHIAYAGYHDSDYCYEIVHVGFQYVEAACLIDEEHIMFVR